MPPPVLDVNGLRIAFGHAPRTHEVVHGISFAVGPGEVLAIVGESGSGKSVTALALLGLLGEGGGRVTGGSALFKDRELLHLPPSHLRKVRGREIGMIFQEPMTSLNPVLTIGRQLTEGLMTHTGCTQTDAAAKAVDMLDRVGIADARRRLGQYPHEFSGGMRQRVMIAMAMLTRPALLLADEPTTALDVTVQAQILDLMRSLIAETGTSLVLITHDMGVVAEIADRVLVMRRGEAVENETAGALFAAPRELYTRALLAAVPRIDGPAPEAPVTGPGRPVVSLDCVSKTFAARRGPFSPKVETRALDAVSLDVKRGETVALVGESGSGKSTLGRAVTRLLDVDTGAILIDGLDVARLSGSALRRHRSKVQMVFQDPYSSLDPRFPVGRTIAEPIIVQGKAGRREAADRAAALLQRVGLDAAMETRLPHEFSGGQRQRIAIARALAAEPDVIVADEPTSALDVSIQAQILDLLAELQEERNIALLFISHDLAVVRQVAHRVAVMRSGRVLETGPALGVLDDARHPYTKALLSAAPVPDPASRGRTRLSVPAAAGSAGPLTEVTPGHWVSS